MVNSIKITLKVCLERKTSNNILILSTWCKFSIASDFAQEIGEPFERMQCSFSFPACVAVVDKSRFKNGLKDVYKCMVYDAVAKCTNTNRSCFRVPQDKLFQRNWLVCS